MAGDEQRDRLAKSEEDRILAAGYQMGKAATLGVLGMDVAAVTGGPGGGTQPYDPSWRSMAGQAGAEGSKLRTMGEMAEIRGHPSFAGERLVQPARVVEPNPRLVSQWAREYSAARGRAPWQGAFGEGFEPPGMRGQGARVADAKAIARQAAKKVPVAAGTAVGAGALRALGVAAPLVAGPGQFLFGEGPGSYAETQQFEPQIASLARYKGGPLDVRDLNPETIQAIASDPGVLSRLYEGGYLSESAAAEISRIRSTELEGVEVERLRALGGVS